MFGIPKYYIEVTLCLFLLFSIMGCSPTCFLSGNAEFEKYMDKNIGKNLSDITGPISIENLLKYGEYTRDMPEPKFQSLADHDENNYIYKSNFQDFVISDGRKCNISLIVDKDDLVINDYVYESRKSACGLTFGCGPW